MAEGVFGSLAISRQDSFGTTNITSFEPLPFVTETITSQIEILRPDTLTGNFNEVDAVRGLDMAEGDFAMVGHPEMTGVLLRACFGAGTVTTANMPSPLYMHQFIPQSQNFEAGVALTPYTIQVYKDTVDAFHFVDSQLTNLTVALTTNDFLRMNVGVTVRTSSVTTLVSGTAPSDSPWVFDQASVSLGGAANIDFENIEISIESNVAGSQTLDGTRTNRFFQRGGKTEVRISGDMNFTDNTTYVQFFGTFTRQRFFVAMKDTSVSSGNEIIFDIPRFRFDSYEATIGGPGRITASFEATGEYDTSSSYSIAVTMINSRETY